MKTVRKISKPFPFFVFFGQKRESRAGTEYFDRKYVDYDRKLVIYDGNIGSPWRSFHGCTPAPAFL